MNCVGITVSNAEQQLHYSTCTLCEAMCGIEVATKGRQILSIKGDKEIENIKKAHIYDGVAQVINEIRNERNFQSNTIKLKLNNYDISIVFMKFH
mgnify:CR=1 FL=1